MGDDVHCAIISQQEIYGSDNGVAGGVIGKSWYVQDGTSKMITVSVIITGLLPVMYGQAIGTDVMKRIAAPLIGGMITAPFLSLIIIPVVYLWWQEKLLKDQGRDIGMEADS